MSLEVARLGSKVKTRKGKKKTENTKKRRKTIKKKKNKTREIIRVPDYNNSSSREIVDICNGEDTGCIGQNRSVDDYTINRLRVECNVQWEPNRGWIQGIYSRGEARVGAVDGTIGHVEIFAL